MPRRHFWALLCAFSCFAALATVRSTSLVGRPFPGFLISSNGVVSAFGSDDWPGVHAGLDAWDVVRSVNGRPVRSAAGILEAVRGEPVGTPIRYGIQRGSRRFEAVVPSRLFGLRDFVREPLPWILTGVFVGGSALFLYAIRPGAATFGFAVFGTAIGVSFFRLDLFGGGGGRLFQAVLPFVPAALVHLALVFPRRASWLVRSPRLLWIPYGISAAIGTARAAFFFDSPGLWTRLDQLSFAYAGVASVFLLGSFTWRAFRSPEIADRERARIVLLGLLPAIVAAGTGLGIRLATGSRWAASSMALAGAWLWVGSLAYAAVKRDLFGLEAVLRHGIGHAVASGVTLLLYGVVVALGSLLIDAAGYSMGAQLPALAVLIAIPFLPGLFESMTRRMQERLFPLRVRLVEVAAGLSEELSRQTEGAEACRAVEVALRERVGLRRAVVFPGDPPEGMTFDSTVAKLRRGESVALFDRERARPVYTWMQQREFTLLLPLLASSRLRGALAVGDPPGGGLFTSEDVDVLSVLASRLAISLANAEAWDRIRALEARLREENQALREELELHAGFPEIVGRSPAMAAVFRMIEQVAGLDTTVLLLGETGTGKGLVARAIHARSPRRDGPLVKVSCAAIPPDLVESELFGHERGSFTGAVSRRHGRFELARHGTLFLDEVAELPLEVQAKLLRVIQEREFERVGGTETIVTDARVLAATNRDLAAEVRAGRFREDLFFRLNVFPIRLPPLRERREDLPLLVAFFLERGNARFGKRATAVAEEGWLEIDRYGWPGNVRELENVIERAMVAADGPTLAIPRLQPVESEPVVAGRGEVRPLADLVREAKIAAIDQALSLAGTQARAAEILGLKPPSLSRMLRDLGLRR